MAEPQPPNTREGADVEEETPAVKGTVEEKKAAAELSALDVRGEEAGSKQEVDQEALGNAIRNLEISSGGQTAAHPAKAKEDAKKKEREEEERRKKAVKVDQADVKLLEEELELSKAKATDLLRTHNGDAVHAMKAYVTTFA